MKAWIYLLVGAALEVVGDFYLKKQNLPVGLGVYFLGSCFWAFSLKELELSRGIVLFTIINLLLVVGIGVGYFGETLSIKQMIGIGLALGSIILV